MIFLRSQDRSAYNMLPDGNCMFRALSHQLFDTVEHHLELRQTLLSVIQNNYATYEPYWIEHTPHRIVKFKDHMKSLANPGSWGTHVELQATSDCFNVTVFICSPNLSGGKGKQCLGTTVPSNFQLFTSLQCFHLVHQIILNFFTVLFIIKV